MFDQIDLHKSERKVSFLIHTQPIQEHPVPMEAIDTVLKEIYKYIANGIDHGEISYKTGWLTLYFHWKVHLPWWHENNKEWSEVPSLCFRDRIYFN